MKKWELARFVIDAKQNIDTLLYIQKNEKSLGNIDLRGRIAKAMQQFYINCCIVLDECYPKQKKKLCHEDAVIDSIYYERDKWYAHKDRNYKRTRFATTDEIIVDVKRKLERVVEKCKEYLPDCFTLDYVPHDKELFRIVHRINSDMERDVYKVKYPKSVFHSYQLSEEGRYYFRDLDTEAQDRRTAELFGYDYDEVVGKKILQSVDDIPEMSSKERERMAAAVLDGLNSYEGIQNRQDFCISLNLLYNQNIWVVPSCKEFKRIEELKRIGIYDEFEIAHMDKLQDEKVAEEYQKIMEKYQCQN